MGFRANWDEGESGQKAASKFPPPGIYLAMIEDAVEEPWKEDENGNQMYQWIVKYLVMEGPHQDKGMRDWMYLSPAAKGRVKWLFSDAGIKLEGNMEATPEMLIGRMVGIEVYEEDWNGKRKTKLKGWLKPEELKEATANTPAVMADKDCPF